MPGENCALPGCGISRKDKINILKVPLPNNDVNKKWSKVSLINPVNSPLQVMRGTWDSVATRSASWEECWTKMYAGKRTQKCNKNKKKKKRGSGIQADYIDKQCLDRYVTWLL